MAEYLIQESTLTSMADKIRSLSGTTEKMTLAEMSSALDGLSGGSGGGGASVAPMINHGAEWAYCTFSVSTDTTVTAGGSVRIAYPASLEIYDINGTAGSPSDYGYGYIYGHPEITAHQNYSAKYGKYLEAVWNSSATDFTLKAGETYTLVFLYHA